MVVPVAVCFEIVSSRQFGVVIMKSFVSVNISHEVLRPRAKQYRYWKSITFYSKTSYEYSTNNLAQEVKEKSLIKMKLQKVW